MGSRRLAPVLSLLCLAALALAQAPRAHHAGTYPAREERPDQRVTLAIDPHDMPDKTADFTVDYRGHGLMPIQLIISNDGAEPVSLHDMKVELITVRRVRIRPAEDDDLFRRLSTPGRSNPNPGAPRLPIPGRRTGPRPSVKAKVLEEIEQLRFRARAVEPGGTQHGFLFFDVQDIANPLAGARFYVSGMRDGKGGEMFYFEIPLEKYLSYRPPK
jgi:hypothetical protein